jgi:Recombinase zinc beta ribbon domain
VKARRRHVVRAPAHLLSGIATCPRCGRGLDYRRHASGRADSYGCVKGPAGCGGTAIKAGLLEEYVTGAVLDAVESPRVQQALRAGEDQHAPRRAVLLEQISDAQERREEARRDYAGRVIDRADWLDIRQRTEDEIGAARREYDRLAATAAGSSMRSGKPCSARERRASSAPACRIAARSWSLRGCRAMPLCVLVPSARPAAGVRASRAEARGARDGRTPGAVTHRDRPRGLRTRLRTPLTPIARPAPAGRRRCRSHRLRVGLVIRASPVTSAQYRGPGRAAAMACAGWFPRAQFPANRQTRYRPGADEAGPPGR